MKTLTTILAILMISLSATWAKDGTFASIIINDPDKPLQLTLRDRQWIKITNFVQNGGNTDADSAGVAVFRGDVGMWVLFANDPHTTNEPLIIAGPAIISVSVPSADMKAFLTYQRGSD
jgi:hypothetical protein